MSHEEQGALPDGWVAAPLSEVANLTREKVDPASTPDADYIGLEHVEAHSMRLLGRGKGSDVKSAKTKFRSGDVLYGKLRPYLNKVCQPPFDGICSTDFLVFGDAPRLDRGYLANYLNQSSIASHAHHISNGVELPRVDWKSLSRVQIRFPTERAKQTLIVEALERSRISRTRAEAHLSEAERATERFRQAVLAAACSGRLTSDWRESSVRSPVGTAPELSQQARANSSGSPNTSDLVEVPDTWAWWSVEAITERVIDYRGRTPPSDAAGLIPHIRTTQIRNGLIDWNADRFVSEAVYASYMTRGIPARGDVLFTMEAPLGEVGLVDSDMRFSIAQRILLLRPGSGLTGEFLTLALRSHPVRRAIEYRATGSGVLGIAYKRLRSVQIPKPPADEQREIVRRASVLLALANDVEERIADASQRLDRTSQALLAKAFRGELPVGTDGT